jgi:hypothetical protein
MRCGFRSAGVAPGGSAEHRPVPCPEKWHEFAELLSARLALGCPPRGWLARRLQ